MHKIRIYLLKIGIILWIPVFILTACTGRDEILLERDEIKLELDEKQDSVPESGFKQTGTGQTGPQEDIPGQTLPAEIYVHICGAVIHPGVYALSPDSRVFEGIEAAGGFREDACEDFINQASVLQDGQKLTVPTTEEVQEAKEAGTYDALPETGAAKERADGLVNINTASEEELSAIPGIGAGKAAAVVRYRQENGAFASIEDIMKVSGIKEGTYEKIKDKITVN